MSLMSIRKGANQGFVFSMGKVLPIFNFYSYATHSRLNHRFLLLKLQVTGLL
jgi:hypothetical protein